MTPYTNRHIILSRAAAHHTFKLIVLTISNSYFYQIFSTFIQHWTICSTTVSLYPFTKKYIIDCVLRTPAPLQSQLMKSTQVFHLIHFIHWLQNLYVNYLMYIFLYLKRLSQMFYLINFKY